MLRRHPRPRLAALGGTIERGIAAPEAAADAGDDGVRLRRVNRDLR